MASDGVSWRRFRKVVPRHLRARPVRPATEALEPRFLLTVVTWISDANGSWDNPANWSNRAIPTGADDVVIDRPSASPVVVVGNADAARSLTAADNVIIDGSLTLAAPSSAKGGITVQNTGKLVAKADLTIGATFELDGKLSGPGNVTAAGSMNWISGSMGGVGATTVAAGAFLGVSGQTHLLRGTRSLNVSGTAGWGGGDIDATAAATVNNYGAFSITSNAVFGNAAGGATFNNLGLLTKSVSDQTTEFRSAPINNTGVIQVETGTIALTGGGSLLQTAGTTTVSPGADFSSAGASVKIQGGALAGGGTITADVFNAAVVSPGLNGAPGVLTIRGNYAQGPTGALAVNIGSPSNVLELLVTGTAQIDGQIAVAFGQFFQPSVGNSFAVLSAASVSGAFASIQGSYLGAGKRINLTFDATRVGVTVVSGAFAVLGTNGTLTVDGTALANVMSASVTNGILTVASDAETFDIPLSSVTHLLIRGNQGNDSITVGQGVPAAVVEGGSGGDTINAAFGDDTVRGGNGNDSIKAGRGDDLLLGQLGDDTLVAGRGTDKLAGGKGRDLLLAGSGADTLLGGDNNDTLVGGSGRALLNGGAGDDVFINGAGANDTVDGGPGLNFGGVNPNDAVTNVTESYDPPPPPAPAANAPLPATSPNATSRDATSPDATSPNAAPRAVFGDVVTATVVGSLLNVFGTRGADMIDVGLSPSGNFVVRGNGAIVGMFPQAGLTGIVAFGGPGDDTITISAADPLPTTLKGGGGNDSLAAGGGDCLLVGGAGNDTLVGGPGANLLVPGAFGRFVGAPTGDDLLVGGPAGSNTTADFARRTDGLHLSNDGLPDSGDVAAGEATTIMPSVKNIFGGSGNDTIVATVPGAFVSGGYGADSIQGAGGGDVLVGGFGSDTVRAAAAPHAAVFLRDGSPDQYIADPLNDILQLDPGLDTPGM